MLEKPNHDTPQLAKEPTFQESKSQLAEGVRQQLTQSTENPFHYHLTPEEKEEGLRLMEEARNKANVPAEFVALREQAAQKAQDRKSNPGQHTVDWSKKYANA